MSTGTTPPKQHGNRQNETANRFNPADQSDSAVRAPPSTEVEERHPSQPRPTTINTPTHRADASQTTSHMASTIWHTVEFSRNRRASIQVLQPVRRQPF